MIAKFLLSIPTIPLVEKNKKELYNIKAYA